MHPYALSHYTLPTHFGLGDFLSCRAARAWEHRAQGQARTTAHQGPFQRTQGGSKRGRRGARGRPTQLLHRWAHAKTRLHVKIRCIKEAGAWNRPAVVVWESFNIYFPILYLYFIYILSHILSQSNGNSDSAKCNPNAKVSALLFFESAAVKRGVRYIEHA